MSIKLLARIGLPYTLRLQQEKELETTLPSDDDFSYFKVTFFPNTEEGNNPYFTTNYESNICNYIELEVIVNNYFPSNYSVIKSCIYDRLEVNETDRSSIFKLVTDKLNDFLIYLSKVTKMFWIKEIPINPISGVIGTRTDFAFLEGKQKIYGSRVWDTIMDDFMVDLYSDSIKPLNKKILDEYPDKYVIKLTWHTYLEKANKAMYLSEYDEFVIYCAIAAESFIKQLITTFSDDEDIVLVKLINVGKNNMVDTYFKVIMKYLYGTNLLEVDQGLYKNLKDIFSLRNDLMHRGYLDDASFKKVGINLLNFEQAYLYITRLDLAIKSCLEIMNVKVISNKFNIIDEK